MFFAPIQFAGIMVLVTSLKDSPSQVPERLKKSYLPMLLTASCVFPFVSFVNFLYVQPKWRMLVYSCFGFAWNIFVSAMLNTPTNSDAEKTEELNEHHPVDVELEDARSTVA